MQETTDPHGDRKAEIEAFLRERDALTSVTIPEEALHEEFDDETIARLVRIWRGEDSPNQS